MSSFLAIPFKRTTGVPTLASQLLEQVSANFDSTHPDEVRLDAVGLLAQRDELFPNSDQAKLEVHQLVLLKLVAYHAQLVFALTKFRPDIGVAFSWFPLYSGSVTSSITLGAFSTAVPVSLDNLQFERINVLFNIAAMYSALGAQETRNTPEGIKNSIAAFQNAAGTLEHVITLLPLIRSTDGTAMNPVSPDLAVDALSALRDLCLAQAQEAAWSKAVMDRLKNGTIAKLASKVSEYYSESLRFAVAAKGAGGVWPLFSFPSDLINHLTIKSLHFSAAAQYRKSMDDLGVNKYGDELGRLSIAATTGKKALAASRKGVAESVVNDIKSLTAKIVEELARADKDDQLIYHQGAKLSSDLPPIVPANVTKSTLPSNVSSPVSFLYSGEGGLGKPWFEKLMGWEIIFALSIYEDRKEEYLRNEISERKRELDAVAGSSLSSMNLPGSIQASVQPIGLPPSLLAKSAEVREDGGSEKIRIMMQDVRKLYRMDRKIVDSTMQCLKEEEDYDNQSRAQYGTDRWTREPSSIANAQLRSRVEGFLATLETTSSTDVVVRKKFGEWEDAIGLLESDPKTMEASVPALAVPELRYSSAPPTAQSTTVRTLRRLLEELDDLKALRTTIVDSAKRIVQFDDIKPQIIREAARLNAGKDGGGSTVEVALFEELFGTELGKYGKSREGMKENSARQEDLLDQIRTTNESFLQARKTDPSLRKREAALQRLDTAYYMYREIAHNLTEGLEFYSNFSSMLNELLNATKSWCQARRAEATDHIQELSNAMSSTSLGERMDQRGTGERRMGEGYDPARDGPIRFG